MRALRSFSPLKAPGPTHIIYETVFTFFPGPQNAEQPSLVRLLLLWMEGGMNRMGEAGGLLGDSSPCRALVQDNHRQPLLTATLSTITSQLLCQCRPAANQGGGSLLLLCFKFIIRVTVIHTQTGHSLKYICTVCPLAIDVIFASLSCCVLA